MCSSRRRASVGPHEIELADGSTVTAASIVLTTGSEPILPPVPGLADGPLWTNVEAIWEPTTVPVSLAIVGGGAIGVEFAQIYARFGSRVTVIEAASHILPAEDEDAAASIAPALEADGIELLTDASIERATYGAEGWELLVGRQVIRAEKTSRRDRSKADIGRPRSGGSRGGMHRGGRARARRCPANDLPGHLGRRGRHRRAPFHACRHVRGGRRRREPARRASGPRLSGGAPGHVLRPGSGKRRPDRASGA